MENITDNFQCYHRCLKIKEYQIDKKIYRCQCYFKCNLATKAANRRCFLHSDNKDDICPCLKCSNMLNSPNHRLAFEKFVLWNKLPIDLIKNVNSFLNPSTSRCLRSTSNYYMKNIDCLLYTSPSPRDRTRSRMPSSA